MFKENIIDYPFWTIIPMSIYKEYLNHTLGLTLSTPEVSTRRRVNTRRRHFSYTIIYDIFKFK